MKSKEIYQAIDLSKVNPELKTKLTALEKATDGFTNERADANMDMAMNKIYDFLKDKKPESLKNIEVKTVEVEEKVETIVEGKPVKKTTKTKKKVAGKKKKVAKKTATPSSGLKKPTVSSVASKIRKPNESWSDALSRAKVIFNEKKQTQVAKTKKAVDDLRDFLKDDKNFTGWPRTYGKEKASDNSLERDAQRQASPPGKRVSKTGRVYYENRDNRADREANSFPRKIFLKEGGDIMIEPTILQNNPNYLVGTETMYEMFDKGGITSRGLFKIQDEVYEKLKFESGSEIKSTSENRYKFSKAVDDALKARGVAKESLSKRIYDKLEDENAHTLNEFLILNDYFQPSVWPEGKKFYFERFKENPRSGLGKDGIVGATTKAPKGTSKGYISHDNIKLIIIKNPNSNGKKKFLQIDGSDVLNGVYDSNAFAKGGTLPKGYKYIRRADVNQVVTKKNEIIFNTKNGFWVDENALTTAETRFEAGGEVFIPTTYLDYNPDYLVGTNTMYEMFEDGGIMAKGGSVDEKDSVYEIELFWKGLERPNRVIKRFYVSEHTLDEIEMRYKYDLEFDVEDEHDFEDVSDKISSFEEVEEFLKKDWENKTNTKFAKGGYIDVQANLMKELQKLQRQLNSQRLLQYTEGDDSQEEMARQRERASKLARFNEILATLRELESKKMAKGGAMEHMVFKGDKVLAIHRNMVIVESDNGVIEVIDFRQEPIARRIIVELITGKNTLASAMELIDADPSFKTSTMAVGGSLQGHASYLIKADNPYQFINGAVAVLGAYSKDEKIESGVKTTLERVKKDLEGLRNYFFSIKDKSVNEPSYSIKADNPYQFINGAVAVLGAYSKDEKIESGVKTTLERVKKDLEGLRKYFFSRKDESLNKKMAMGGSLQGHGLEVGDLIVEDLGGYIRVVSEDGKDFFITLRTGDRETEAPLPFKHGGKVKHSDVTRLATKTNEAGDELDDYLVFDMEDEGPDYNSISSLEDELRRLIRFSNQFGSKGADAKIEQLKRRIALLKNRVNLEEEVDLTEFYEGGGNVPKVFDVPAQFLDSEGKRKNDKKTIKELTDFVLGLPQTKSIYYNDNLGGYTPSRKKLHAEIINKFKKEVVCINNDKPIAIFMGGSPASGKSSFLRKYSPFLLKEEILKIDADEIRAMLPEYEGWNATQTHLETKDIVNTLLSNKNIGIPCDFDIIYDGTMNSVKSYIPLMDILRKRGYKIFIVFMDNVPKDVIIKRALDRYKKSGRFVPLEVIEDFFSKGKSAFNELKKDVDGYMRIDGSSQDYKVLEEGGMKLPRDREYSKLGTKIKASDIPVSYKKGGLSKLY